MLSKAFLSQSYKLAHSDFGDMWKEAGCTEQSSFFPGQDVNLWKCLFCDSGIRNTRAGMAAVPVLALISALCMCPWCVQCCQSRRAEPPPPFCAFRSRSSSALAGVRVCALAACEEPLRSYSLLPAQSQALERKNSCLCGREFAFAFGAGGSSVCLWLAESEAENPLLLPPHGREMFWGG